MALPEGFIDELIQKTDIADLVSDYVQLKQKGGASYWGLCPFHSEKTPSFHVETDRQIYHCFGCGKGGGAINFVMDIENLSFIDAVSFLAKRAGMEMPEDGTPEETRSRRARMLELNRDAARFYYSELTGPRGKAALDYVKKRGISPAMVKKFGLGAAPDEWTALTEEMKKKGYSEFQLVDAGLAKRGKSGGVYDTFRNRLMFPVIDVRGSVLGFSGRILDDGEPKYLNSPDTAVFSKSRNLFALNLAKKSKMGMLILAEGNIDVVSLHQAGFDCAVASLGTSLTEEQARLMSRYTEKVVIAYDNDGAGRKASERAIGIFEHTGISCRVLRMDGAKDPDEFIKAKGAEAFSVLLERSENHVEYRLLAAKSKYDLDSPDGKMGYLREATAILSSLTNEMERDVYTAKVASETGARPDSIRSEIKKLIGVRKAAMSKKESRAAMRVEINAQPKAKELKYDNPVSASGEEGVVRILMKDPALSNRITLKEEEFTSPFLRKVFALIMERVRNGEGITEAAILPFLSSDEASHLGKILEKPETAAQSEKALQDYINKIRSAKKTALTDDDALIKFSEKQKKTKGYGG